jgi:hypothetical protein
VFPLLLFGEELGGWALTSYSLSRKHLMIFHTAAMAPGIPTPKPTPKAMFLSVLLLPPPPVVSLLLTPSPFPVLFPPLPQELLLPHVVCRLIRDTIRDGQDHKKGLEGSNAYTDISFEIQVKVWCRENSRLKSSREFC